MEQAQKRKLEREQLKREKRREAVARREKAGGSYDYIFMLLVLFLICFGLVMLYSTSYYSAQIKFGDGMYYFKRQAIFSAVAFLMMLIVARVDYHLLAALSGVLLAVSWAMMLAVRFTPLGIESYGARRWMYVPIIGQIQPSEITKIAIILFVPYMINRLGKEFQKLTGIIKVFAVAGVTALGTFVLTDHLSAAIIIVGIVYTVVFVANRKSGFLGTVAAVVVTVMFTVAKMAARIFDQNGNFRIQRLLVWNDPEKYMSDGGYQILQGLYAIGSGGFFGKGLGNSSQKLGFIPEAQNDMIVSILCEELGVFGVILLLLAFGLLLYRLVFIARNAPDQTGALIVAGVFSHIALQVILNLCVVLNIIPTTGITLPFISYGGSAIIFLMAEMGIVLGVACKTKEKIARQEEEAARAEEEEELYD